MGKRGFRNQTELHEWLAGQTFNFLYKMCTQRGLIWRQEHTLHNGMRPDAVGFCSLQFQYEKLFNCNNRSIWNSERVSDFMFVFESKVSYSDYKNSFNGSGEWKEKPYANFHFLVVPKDFSKTYDLSNLPDYWGILEPNVSALHIVKMPKYFEIDRVFFLESAYTILFKWGIEKQLLERDMEELTNHL